MNRKPLRRVSLLGIIAALAAFAVMPGTAQAVNVPRWYANGTEIAKGNEAAESPYPFISWGTLSLEAGAFGIVTCQTILSGKLVNPVETLPAEAAFEAYQPFNCTMPTCEALSGGHVETATLGSGENILGERSEVEHIAPAPKPFINAVTGRPEPKGGEWLGAVTEVSAGSRTYELFIGNRQPAVLGVNGTTTSGSKIMKLASANTEIKVGMEVSTTPATGQTQPFAKGEAGTVTKVLSTTEIEVSNTAGASSSVSAEFETTKAKHRIRFRIACHAKAVVGEFFGELHPTAQNNGTVIGAAPSELEFKGATSGELQSSPPEGATLKGQLKVMGFEGGAIIKIKSI
jgi:hypothetical protein